MSSLDDLDSHLTRTGLPYEQLGHSTWVISPQTQHSTSIAVSADEPIVLFSLPVLELSTEQQQEVKLFRALLELNAELLHSSYSLQGNKVVLSGAQQLENLDFNEFQAMIDDMCMALDNHWDKLSEWGLHDQNDDQRKAGGDA
ncbi:MAG: YbjN domain-containing protein [Deltaproteobacteria bacterium]|nr:YbjN domain-containing protein [Deltaproteobacteria bacterium]